METPPNARIRWAPKLRTEKLIGLYESNASGTLDPDLVDDVGWHLWERISDVVLVSTGKVRCPACSDVFQVRYRNSEDTSPRSCPGCGWTTTLHEWAESWRHRDLNGYSPAFDTFLRDWPAARSVRDRMILIDGVVHALHVATGNQEFGNFSARNFIEGSRPKIVALLDELASGPGSAVHQRARQRWQAARDAYQHERSRGRTNPAS